MKRSRAATTGRICNCNRALPMLALLLLVAQPAWSLFVVGRLSDAATGSPLHGIEVSLAGEATLSDAGGDYRLQTEEVGLLRVSAGERFTEVVVPVARTQRLDLPLIPARVTLGERSLSFLDFFRDAARRSHEGPDHHWLAVWDGPVSVFLDPALGDELLARVRESWSLPAYPDLGAQEPLRYTDDELRAQVYVRPVEGGNSLSLTYDAGTGLPLGAVFEVDAATPEAETRRFLQRGLLRLFGLHPLGEADHRRELSVLGGADSFTRLDAMALAVARRLPVGTDLRWYGPRLELDQRYQRLQVLALPFAMTHEDPYMSNIAATSVARALDDTGPFFNLQLHPDLTELGRLAEERRRPPSRLLRSRAYTLDEAVELARELDCRYVFWGYLIDRGETARAGFYAADAEDGRLLVNVESPAMSGRLHFPRFIDQGAALLARSALGPPQAAESGGAIQLHFNSVYASVYVHALVNDSLVAVLHPNNGEFLLPVEPGPHRVSFRYFLPLLHLGCVIGVPAGEAGLTVEVEPGLRTSVATLFAINPTQAGLSWNYARTRVLDASGALLHEDQHDLDDEQELIIKSVKLIEASRLALPWE